MCCRYYMDRELELSSIVEEMNRSPLGQKMVQKLGKPLCIGGEVKPSYIVPVIAPGNAAGEPRVFPMIWGYRHPGTGKALINCRAETAGERPLWKEAWRAHRCAIPASWYFEWEHPINPRTGRPRAGQKYRIRPREEGLTWLAGLYHLEEIKGLRVPTFSILTREPAEGIRFIHDRMPLILPRDEIAAWIDPRQLPEPLLEKAVTELYAEKETI